MEGRQTTTRGLDGKALRLVGRETGGGHYCHRLLYREEAAALSSQALPPALSNPLPGPLPMDMVRVARAAPRPKRVGPTRVSGVPNGDGPCSPSP